MRNGSPHQRHSRITASDNGSSSAETGKERRGGRGGTRGRLLTHVIGDPGTHLWVCPCQARRCRSCVAAFPHTPFAVGFGRSGPSQTCPRTRWSQTENTSSDEPEAVGALPPSMPAVSESVSRRDVIRFLGLANTIFSASAPRARRTRSSWPWPQRHCHPLAAAAVPHRELPVPGGFGARNQQIDPSLRNGCNKSTLTMSYA